MFLYYQEKKVVGDALTNDIDNVRSQLSNGIDVVKSQLSNIKIKDIGDLKVQMVSLHIITLK